mmetsp:Transcript_23166/g.26858  ORF Transcript_23166/g.26858 Transcript_23166/m.26858 type:complete len:230 (+) Transcript_23166:574-1263(+)
MISMHLVCNTSDVSLPISETFLTIFSSEHILAATEHCFDICKSAAQAFSRIELNCFSLVDSESRSSSSTSLHDPIEAASVSMEFRKIVESLFNNPFLAAIKSLFSSVFAKAAMILHACKAGSPLSSFKISARHLRRPSCSQMILLPCLGCDSNARDAKALSRAFSLSFSLLSSSTSPTFSPATKTKALISPDELISMVAFFFCAAITFIVPQALVRRLIDVPMAPSISS